MKLRKIKQRYEILRKITGTQLSGVDTGQWTLIRGNLTPS